MPEASVAAEWQCTQPWVCTMLLIELLVPPTGNPKPNQLRLQGLDVGEVGQQELDVVAAGEAQIPAAVFVGQIAQNLRIVWMLSKRGEPARTVYSLSPDSATWHRTPGAMFSWYFHLP